MILTCRRCNNKGGGGHKTKPLGDRQSPHPLMAVDRAALESVYSHQSLMGLTNTPSDLLPGTLELLILKALRPGAKHGYGIVEHLRAGVGRRAQESGRVRCIRRSSGCCSTAG